VISSRVVLRLALGILFGVALVLIPSVFPTQTPTQSSGNWNPVPAPYQRSNPATLQPLAPFGLSPTNLAGLSLLIIIVFIFLPSAIFSLVVRRWAAKRARDIL
jgi:hypothetical protein